MPTISVCEMSCLWLSAAINGAFRAKIGLSGLPLAISHGYMLGIDYRYLIIRYIWVITSGSKKAPVLCRLPIVSVLLVNYPCLLAAFGGSSRQGASCFDDVTCINHPG